MKLDLWEKWNQPPSGALKRINAGRLRGKTDINPQWRYKVLTEVFGPCGIGWKYCIREHWTEPGSDGQIMCFVIVDLYIKNDGEWSEAIPGIGGSTLIIKEIKGLYSNDEAFKMALTDALSVAFAKIGVAADIYMGLWDGSKYRTFEDEPYDDQLVDDRAPQGKESDKNDIPRGMKAEDMYLSVPERKKMWTICENWLKEINEGFEDPLVHENMFADIWREFIRKEFGVESKTELRVKHLEQLEKDDMKGKLYDVAKQYCEDNS